ncbi:MAG: thermonuclease family protein [Bacteroidales bacterium]|nr:thermonuclease family protein [Bacteroidales bacterium]
MKKAIIFILLLVLLSTSFCDKKKTQQEDGEVLHVTDGDTFDCMYDGEEITIRLYGIDAPESGQPYGNEAENWLRNQIGDEAVDIEKVEEGYYGRTIAIVELNGTNINGALVKNGLAWVSDRYCDRDSICDRWRNYQQQARGNDVGLWGQPNPTPPWEFRDQ